GGTVKVDSSAMLNVTGEDLGGCSYWQTADSRAQLQVGPSANINAVGTYEISAGTVQFKAPSGSSADELDGAGLIFYNDSNPTLSTTLRINDSTFGTPGDVKITGPVTLASRTETNLHFDGATNTADVLDVRNGALTLNG